MEIVKYFIVISTFLNTFCFSQSNESIVCDDIMIKSKTSVFNGDTLKHVMISKITVNENTIYKEQTLAMMFENDSLFAHSYDRYPNNGKQVTGPLGNSCKLYDSISEEKLNSLIEGIVLNLLRSGHEIMLVKPMKAKSNFDALQKILVIIDSEKLSFLIDFCSFINLDLPSLETHFLKAKFDDDERRMFLISQAFRMNTFDEIIKTRFDLIWSELLDKYSYFEFENLLTENELSKLKNSINKTSKPFILKDSCIIDF